MVLGMMIPASGMENSRIYWKGRDAVYLLTNQEIQTFPDT